MGKRTRRDIITSLSPTYRYNRQVVPKQTVHRLPRVSYQTNRFALSLIEDRRTFYPSLRPVQQMAVGKPARLAIKQKTTYRQPSQTKGVVAFEEPGRLPICVRRKQREQVLFAKGVAGSRKPQKKPRRNEFSDVACI